MTIEEYSKEYMTSLREDAAISGTDTEDVFYERTLETLQENGEFDDPVIYYFGKTGRRNRFMQINGYCFDDTDKSLVLFIYDFVDSITPGTLTNSQIDILYKRLYAFLDEAVNGNISDYCDASDEVIPFSELISRRIKEKDGLIENILKIRFYIITNKSLSNMVKKIKQDDFLGCPVEVNLWHLERFFELSQSMDNEPVVIKLKDEFNVPGIPCIEGKIGSDLGYKAYIAIIPGKLLADIYIAYGSKVLEGNVRAFLGTGGSKSVNSGIRRTIIKEPTRFFTYNNGIATTASHIETENACGQLMITEIEDLQIINGGQTTASLAEAVLKKTNPELEGLFVPMKLTVIEDRDTVEDDGVRFYDSMVEKIARFANSQNKVTAADFFSNNPFHVVMEQMSKRYLAPPVNGNPNPSGWYYERTKKKYNQEQVKMTKAERDRFALKYPRSQIIKKEQLAKYIYAIDCKPYLVARGQNWVMKEFGFTINEAYKKDKNQFNEFYFKKCVAAAILYRSVDNYLEKLKKTPGAWYTVGGYKLDIVPYTISKIISSIPQGLTIDWLNIWQHQRISLELMTEIELMTKYVNDFICKSHGMIVTEYCKKQDTWDTLKSLPYQLSPEFIDTLLPVSVANEVAEGASKSQKEDNSVRDSMAIVQKGSHYWKQLLQAGIRKNLVNYKDASLLKVAIEIESTGKLPSALQTKAILKIEQRLLQAGVDI